MQTQNPQTMNINSPFFSVDVTRAAQDARLYRIAARDLRREARKRDRNWKRDEREELLAGARRMERNARMAEKAIVRAADELLTRGA